MTCVPRRFYLALQGEIKQTHAFQEIRELVDEKRLGLTILCGGPGTGKSFAAAWAARNAPLDYHWVDSAALVARGLYGDYKDVFRAELLVIDDLGVEYQDAKGVAVSILDRIINHRYAEVMPLIVTTNIPADKLAARLGSRIVDRIREYGTIIGCGDKTLRSSANPWMESRAEEDARLKAEEREKKRKHEEWLETPEGQAHLAQEEARTKEIWEAWQRKHGDMRGDNVN